MKIGKMYKKSLRDLLKGPLAIHDKRDIVRYRNLEKLGLVAGVGIRCVSLTKAGKLALATGETKDEVTSALPVDAPMYPTPLPPLAPFRWEFSADSMISASELIFHHGDLYDF